MHINNQDPDSQKWTQLDTPPSYTEVEQGKFESRYAIFSNNDVI